ncbi:MAG: 50S ribosomal protein L30 [Chloroflexi bacterium CFX6]|nr:50S ribosomal protein L30 [Chloroflexi bacterium CFX6]
MDDGTNLVRITYVKSSIGYAERQKRTVRSLGLRRLGDSVVQPDNPAVRGMVRAVQHLVTIESVPDAVAVASDGEGGQG